MGDRLNDVIAVEVLQRLEEIIGAARAASATHVDVDNREAHQVGQDRDPTFGPGRVRVSVARILDQGRRRATRQRRQFDTRQHVGHVLRRVDIDRQLGPVARGQVAVSTRRDRLFVDVGAGRRGLGRENPQGSRLRAPGDDPVAVSRRDVAKEDPAEVIGALRRDFDALFVVEGHRRPRRKPGRVDLFDAPVRLERRGLGAQRKQQQGDQTASERYPRRRPAPA